MTAEQFYEWAKHTDWDRRFELIDGEPAERPLEGQRHGVVCGIVCRIVSRYLSEVGAGYACSNNAGLIVARSPDTVLGPDVMAFRESVAHVNELSPGFATRPPALVAEVLSENDRPTDAVDRVQRYLKAGVPLVWLVDSEAYSVSEYRSGSVRVLQGDETIEGHDALPGLRCRASDFFEVVLKR